MDDVATSMYYTLSSIAQVLAAFLALSGVFVINKIKEYTDLQIIKLKYLISRSEEIANFVDDRVIIFNLRSNLNRIQTIADTSVPYNSIFEIDKFILIIQKNIKNPMVMDLFNLFHSVKLTIEQHQTMKNILKLFSVVSIGLGVLVISFSIIVLANTHTQLIKENSCIVFIIAISITIFCMLLMFIAISFSIIDMQNFKLYPRLIRFFRKFI